MLIVNPACEGVTESWFDPAWWGDNAQLISSGGRGSAWFVRTNLGEMVLRHYRRGGLVGKVVSERYVFTGYQRARSIAEFRLSQRLYELGLPVPEPVAAVAWKKGALFYQAAIIVKRIPEAVTLPESSLLAEPELWRQLGQVIRRFHDAGLNHVDLNCDNILVSDSEIFLIDFDRCSLSTERKLSGDEAWKKKNIERLRRSIEKRCSAFLQGETDHLWNQMLCSYRQFENISTN